MKQCIMKPGIVLAFHVGVDNINDLNQYDMSKYGIKSWCLTDMSFNMKDGTKILTRTGDWLIFGGGTVKVMDNETFSNTHMESSY